MTLKTILKTNNSLPFFMKVFFSFLFLSFFLLSCGKSGDTLESTKQDFLISTQPWTDFSGAVSLEKTGKVSSSQDIQLTSQASWRVTSVSVKAGDTVKVGQTIALLDDTIGSYAINLQRASNGVERAQINYDSTKLQFEKQIFDTQINLEKLERNLSTAKQDSQQTIKQASDSLENSQYENLDSRSALQIEQLDNNIKKAQLDFENKKIADGETIEGFKTNLKKDLNTLIITLDDIIQFSDEILGVTEKNKYKNENIQTFLWVKDISQKSLTKTTLINLIAYRDGAIFQDMEKRVTQEDLSEEQIIEAIDFINTWYEQTKTLLNNMEQTLNNSLESVWVLGPIEISTFIGKINGYQASLQWNYAGFLAFGNQTKSFIRTYENSQESIEQSLALQKKDREIQLKSLASGELTANVGYERTVLSTQNAIADLESQITLLRNTLENTKKNYDITLRSLENAIREAQIGYVSAEKEYAKLTLRSPINGTVSEVFVDKWQEVSPGIKIADIISDNTPEVQIAFSVKEKELVKEGQEVYIDVWVERITGSIYSVSEVADVNLNYTATVVFESGTNILGSIVTVRVPLQTEKRLMPLGIMKTQWQGKSLVNLYTGTGFIQAELALGAVFWDMVEVLSCTYNTTDCGGQKVVLNDISNYDPMKFTIKEQEISWKK